MKRLLLLLFVFLITVSLFSGCDLGDNTATTESTQSISTTAAPVTTEPTTAEKQIQLIVNDDSSVTLAVPSEYVSMNEKTAEEYAEENDYLSVVLREDGKSYSITMTGERHTMLLGDMTARYESYVDMLTADSDEAYIDSVEHNDDYSEIKISVNREKFANPDMRVITFTLANYSTIYRIFSGMEPNTTETIVYSDDGEVITTLKYPQY